MRLREEVYEKEAFSAHVTDDYVLVSLDFPRGEDAKAAVPNPARNEELMQQYGVEGFPTVLLMTPDGEVFGRTGYTGASPEDYLADVQRQRKDGKAALAKIKSLQSEFDTAENEMEVVKKAADTLKNLEGGPGGEILANMVRKGFELDPENKEGLKIGFLQTLLESGLANEADLGMAKAVDAKNEFGLMEHVVANAMNTLRQIEDLSDFLVQTEALYATGKVHNKELVAMLWVNSAYFCDNYLERPKEAKTWAQRAKDLGGLEADAMEVVEKILSAEDPS